MSRFLIVVAITFAVLCSAAVAKEQYPNFGFSAELRTRGGFSDGYDFNRALSDDRYPFLNRLRVDFDWHISPSQRIKITPQYSYWDRLSGDAPKQGDQFIVYQAYYEIRDPKNWAWEWRLGRQEIQIEDGTLVGATYWDNIGQVWDGASFSKREPTYDFTVFGARQGEWRGRGAEDRYVAGIAASTHPYSPDKLFGHIIYKADRSNAPSFIDPVTYQPLSGPTPDLDQYTVGGGYHFRPGTGFDAVLGGDYQFGDSGANNVSAYRYYVKLSNAINDPAPFKIGTRFYYLSGDSNPADTTINGFNPPYPDYYATHGRANVLGPPNLRDWELYSEMKLGGRLSVAPTFHMYWTATQRGAVYNSRGGMVTGPDATRNGSSYLGSEFDLELRYRPVKDVDCLLGWAHFKPGDFFREVVGTNDPTEMVYLEVSYLYR